MRREVWQPTHEVHTSRKIAKCHLVPGNVCSEIWIMQLSPLWKDGRRGVGVVSLWKPELLGRFCQSKDRSPNCISRDRVLIGAVAAGSGVRNWSLCSVVQYLIAGSSTDCCRGVTYTKYFPPVPTPTPHPNKTGDTSIGY